MKRFLLLLLLISSSCFAQFKLKYGDIQNKYENIINEKHDTLELMKVFDNTATVGFFFTKTDHTLVAVSIYKGSGLSNKEFDYFLNEFVINFTPTRIQENPGVNVYYDEAAKLIAFKGFMNESSNIVNTAIFSIEKETIDPFIKLMDEDGVKSKLKR